MSITEQKKSRVPCRLILAAVTAAAVFLGVSVLCCTAGSRKLCIGGRCFDPKVSDTPDVCRIAEALGAETDGESFLEEKIFIPESFNSVYEEYERLQQETGLSLEGYKGREAVKYSAVIVSKDNNDEMILTILVCDGQFIGGDVTSRDFYGKQLPLSALTSGDV